LIVRLVDDGDEDGAREVVRKIAPELDALEELAVPAGLPDLLQKLLDGQESPESVLPRVPDEPPPGASPHEVAAQQMTLLRHALRSAVLTQFVRSVLLPHEAGGDAHAAPLEEEAKEEAV
jgi:hypothetical protein